MTFRPLILAAAAAAATIATPAFADSVKVEYKDLDLSSDTGRATLQARIETAAREVCGLREITTGSRVPSTKALKCYDEVMADMNRTFAAVIDKANNDG